MIAAGSMRDRLAIYQSTVLRSPTGSETSSWTPIATVWAARKSLSLRDVTRMSGVAQAAEARFDVRYRTDLVTGMEVTCAGHRFVIVSIDQIGIREGLALLVRAV